eukprot:740501-Prymnesium_polylepis.1
MVEVGHQFARQAADVDDALEEADDLLDSLGVHVPSSTVWMRCRTRSALSLGTHMMPRLG